ncbi:hypothetical protein BH10PSE9_BH10PSE9_07060 [soil metagenome]
MTRLLALPHVMLVEDESVVLQHLAAEFEDAGWGVVEASSAEEALALYQGHPVDAAVIDIQLAGYMNGVELANVLRAVGHAGPFVFVSGRAMPRGPMPAGSVFHPKPVDASELIRTTRRLLSAQEH